MLKTMRSWLAQMGGKDAQDRFEPHDPRLAMTALLLRVMTADGIVELSEKNKLVAILKDDFGLGRGDCEALLEAARRLNAETSDFSVLAEHAKRGLDQKGRLKLLDRLWDITTADNHIHEFEDSLVWRVADILGVPVHERVASRRRAGRELREN